MKSESFWCQFYHKYLLGSKDNHTRLKSYYQNAGYDYSNISTVASILYVSPGPLLRHRTKQKFPLFNFSVNSVWGNACALLGFGADRNICLLQNSFLLKTSLSFLMHREVNKVFWLCRTLISSLPACQFVCLSTLPFFYKAVYMDIEFYFILTILWHMKGCEYKTGSWSSNKRQDCMGIFNLDPSGPIF